MIIGDEAFHDRIEATVGEVEKGTSAEVVVAFAPRSGSYRDAEMLGGLLLSLAGALAAGLHAWWTGGASAGSLLGALLLPADLLVAFLLGTLLSSRVAPLGRLFASRARRVAQARRGALLAFQEEGVGATRERNGVLFYVSVFEDAVEVVPDLGVEGKIPGARWNELLHSLPSPRSAAFPERFLDALRKAGALLAERFPAGAENPDEIPNRPRIRT